MAETIPRLLPQGVLMTGIIGIILIFVGGFLFDKNLPLEWASAFGILFLFMIIGSFVPLWKPVTHNKAMKKGKKKKK